MRVLAIGYWHGPMVNGLLHPQGLVDETWEPERRTRIVSYLDAGVDNGMRWAGDAFCRFGCPGGFGSRDLTDGRWLWPQGLSHYLKDHHIRLPQDFVISAASSNFRSSHSCPSGYDLAQADFEFWFDWCRANMDQLSYEPLCYWCTKRGKRA